MVRAMHNRLDEELGLAGFLDAADGGQAGAQPTQDDVPREAFRQLFNTELGRTAIEYLYRKYVHGLRWQPGEQTETGPFRDGMAAVVCDISNLAYGPQPETER